MVRNGYDIASGVVIGDIETRSRYRFISKKTGWPQGNDMYFRNDEDAMEYAKIHYPDAFKNGIEMQVFDN